MRRYPIGKDATHPLYQNYYAMTSCICNRGMVSNLLKNVSLDKIKKSKDLAKQLDIGDLKRLTEKEYISESKKYRSRHPIKPELK